jgi:hypothetical protein
LYVSAIFAAVMPRHEFFNDGSLMQSKLGYGGEYNEE